MSKNGFLRKKIFPISVVTLVLLVIWLAASVQLNSPMLLDRYQENNTDWNWQLLTRDAWSMNRPVLPSPQQVFVDWKKLVFQTKITSKRSLVYHSWVTLSSTLLGFFLGITLGIILAVGIVYNRTLERSLLPWVIASQTIPILALAPMIIVVLGAIGMTGLVPKAIISAYLAFFPVTIGMVKGLRSPDPLQMDLARTYHASGAQIRPTQVEGEATNRAIVMAKTIGVPVYIVHVTCRESVEVITSSRAEGQAVFGETCPHYLLLDDSVYDTQDFSGAAYVMSPPIRPKKGGHQRSLWGALKAGQIQTVATDHCPFNLKGQKELGKEDFRKIPNGAAGIQHRLALMYTYGVLEEKLTLKQFVEVNSTRPAQLFGMYPRKGTIAVGSDADLVLWNPETEGVISASTHHHHVDTNIFEGYKTKGAPTWVIANGKVQYDEGNLKVEKGAGRYISRKTGISL